MPSLLLEVGTEELPARFVEPARRQLERLLQAELVRERLVPASVRTWATPRRLAALATGLPDRQPDTVREVRGPAAPAAFDPEGRPTAAAVGFARSQGVPVESLERRSTPAGEYVFARRVEPGRDALDVLQEVLPRVVASLSFPKTMRWAGYDLRFARPIRWVVALLDDQVVPFELAGVRSGRRTYGHRQLSPGPHELRHAVEYEEVTRKAFVLADREARRAEVVLQVQRCAQEAGGEPDLAPDLVDEVTDLVEWPTAFLGRFDARFVAGEDGLPEPVLVTVMRHHQRYFPVRSSGGLINAFVGVRNGDHEGLDAVREGNEWVLRARLVDAAFFYREDRKHPLEHWAERLASVTFHEKLGSMREKVDRLVRLCRWLAQHARLDPVWADSLARAARLCKADLVTHMVGEFPELQGTVGAIYARMDGESQEVCEAIEQHYRPRGAGDELPGSPLGALLALADRADTLAGFLGVGIVPTGSADPYGLRRTASGLLDILHDRRQAFSLGLAALVQEALAGYGDRPEFAGARERVADFLRDRVRAWMLEHGFAHDVVEAALAVYPGVPDFLDAVARADALQEFRTRPEFAAAYEAFDRAYRIWDKHTAHPPSPLEGAAEHALGQAVRASRQELDVLLQVRAYLEALRRLAALQGPVGRLFDEVLVNDPDPQVRARRHGLLGQVVGLFWRVAHLEHLVVSRES
ncbi:MAG: glycine--tRNA ligase subunit beta [Armatimonadota bacterium]|nr:glycine--tRNA ligase subunit beta [Armatimonadota bacterium]MDW8157197.1 glycine--tRNA ligase subunit beta [Armatimonadota bacterium]